MVGIHCALSLSGIAEEARIIDRIPDSHPRIILTDQRVAEIKEMLKDDKDLQILVQHLETMGEAILEQPPASYDLEGDKVKRLLSTSRNVLQRTLVLGTLYRLSGQKKWKDRLTKELLAVCAFPDWHHKHFLDTAEMAAAVAIGYDWIYDGLSERDRKMISEGLHRHALARSPHGGFLKGAPSAGRVHGKNWVQDDGNWNQVCHGGMVLAALAAAHDFPKEAEALLQSAKHNFKTGMKAYAPLGIFPEGPGYWDYGTSYSTIMDSAVKSTLGADWGILGTQGFKESFTYRIHIQGPTGQDVNYSDGGDHDKSSPCHFYLAGQTNTPGYRTFAMESMQRDLNWIDEYKQTGKLNWKISRFYPLAIAWYIPDVKSSDLPLDFFGNEGEDKIHLAMMRSAWNKQALFASLKAGKLQSHGHLDAGTVVIEAEGVRWASEFGIENAVYDSKGSLWSQKQDSDRWSLLRIGNFGHNTLTIDNQRHRVDGASHIVAYKSGASPFAVADLSPVFNGQAKKVRRGLAMPGRKQILVQDEIEGVAAGKQVRWNLNTQAKITLSNDRKTATFTYKNKTMTVSLLAPSRATFTAIDATPPTKIENQNKGYERLLVDVESEGKPFSIAVLFTPGKVVGDVPVLSPLANWNKSAPKEKKAK